MLIRFEDRRSSGDFNVTTYEAQQLWPYLCGQAHNRRIVKYSEVNAVIGRGELYQPIAGVLGHISFYCHFNHIPVLPVIVHNRYGVPGPGFDLVLEEEYDRHREWAFDFPWFNLKVPTLKALKKAYDRGVSGERISGKILTA